MVNALLQRRGRFGAFVFLPMHVATGGLGGVITALRQVQNFAGAIVSMPHKVAIVGLLDELTADAQSVGAVNVVRRNADGRIVGTVFDGEGFVGGLRSAGHEIDGASCLLAGAGGAATAIAFALAREGCRSLAITNRTASKAEALASRVRQAFPHRDVRAGAPHEGRYDIAINATSLGMKADDELPLSPDVLERATLVAECVVAPEKTRLLEVAREKGCAIHTGVPMLAAQIDLMLRFTGVE